LPKPTRLKESTEPLQVAQAQPPRAAIEVDQSGPDPIAETRQRAMARLADFLLDYSGKSENEGESRGLRAIVRGTGQFSLQQAEQTKVVKHLSQAIEAQMNGQDEQAAEELEHALEAGFNHPSLYFDLGLLRSKGDRLESALRHLRYAVKHQDYALGARLLMAQILHVMGRFSKATMEYLEALKLADATVVPAEYSDEIRQAYEPLIESLTSQADQEELSGLCESIGNLLMRPNWREHLRKVREQLPQTQQDETPMPVVEVLTRVRSSQALEAMSRLHQLARAGKLRLAMEEAFYALNYAPTYLPLHTLIGDLLVQEERTEEAIAKFTVVARTYDTYGEAALATKLLKRIIQLSPMDMEARAHLIDQLVARGHVDEAINEYVELAGMYYRLAELDVARKTYITALNLTQQAKADRTWNVHILQRIADIDMQRLDWRQALPVLEQIRVLDPDDEEARRQLIDLHLRLDQQSQAMYELGDYLSFLEENSRSEEALAFLENLVKDHGSRIDLRRALAEQYRKTSQLDQAIEQLNLVVESLLQLGDRQGAVETVNLILSMNPTNRGAYQKLLTQIQASG
jgi:tetratricopeptide (TPR) repeat protein